VNPADDPFPLAPNVFVVGAAKAGTTSLAEYLGRQPGWFVPWLKEPHYLSAVGAGPGGRGTLRTVRSQAEYRRLYDAGVDADFRVDASTSYLPTAGVAARIDRMAPDARVVAVLRSPSERAYSHYLNNVREGTETRTFAAAVTAELDEPDAVWTFDAYLGLGLYASQVEEYVRVFGKRFLIACFEELVASGSEESERLAAFLGVPPPADAGGLPRVNDYARPRSGVSRRVMGSPSVRAVARAMVPRRLRSAARGGLLTHDEKPAWDPQVRETLSQFFAADREALEIVARRTFPW
jgi:Sulfotransferase family